ncbi:MAG: helix-turn-helix domain-containing protein, partial [Candidatus Omnitrophota bacterium]
PFLSMSQNAGFASAVRGSKEGCEAILKKSLTPLLNDPTIPKDAAFFKNLTSGLDKLLIEVALEKARKNQLEASKMLGINRNTLRKRMKLYGLSSE